MNVPSVQEWVRVGEVSLGFSQFLELLSKRGKSDH